MSDYDEAMQKGRVPGRSVTKNSSLSNMGSETLSSLLGDEDDDDEDFESVSLNGSVNQELPPLFVHLTCSVRACKSYFLKSIPAKSLPTCLSKYKTR